jgi:hypothetical protein
MSDHTVIAILVGVLTLFAAAIGHIYGQFHRHQQRVADRERRLEEQVRAQGALLHVIAEDYEPTEPTERDAEERRAAFRLLEGGGGVLLLAALSAWLRAHWRGLSTALAGAGASSILGAALLAHGTPIAAHPGAAPAPSHAATATAHRRPNPITKPRQGPRVTPPLPPVIPLRSRRPTQAASPTPSATGPKPPPPLSYIPSLNTSTSPIPAPIPTPTATATCPLGTTLHLAAIGIALCL